MVAATQTKQSCDQLFAQDSRQFTYRLTVTHVEHLASVNSKAKPFQAVEPFAS